MNQPQFACSTMWNIRQHQNPLDALTQMKEIGFQSIELNYLVTQQHLDVMLPLVDNGTFVVSSVHNVLPKVSNSMYDTDSPFLSFCEEEKRQESIRLTKKTLDHAHRLGASAVVMHVSSLELEQDYDTALRALYDDGKRNTASYETLLHAFLAAKEKQLAKVLSRTLDSLHQIADYREKMGYRLQLGIENRSKIDQIPTLIEARTLVTSLGDPKTGFWYDIGHGVICETLGILTVEEELSSLQDCLIGMHIHDAAGISDHFEPYHFGDGFDRYLPWIARAPHKVFELGPKCDQQAVRHSLEKLTAKLQQLNCVPAEGRVPHF